VLATCLMLLAANVGAASPRAAPEPVLASGAYVCGGIGEEGQHEIATTRDLYNLRLTMAESGTGAYVTGVLLVIDPVGRGERYGPFEDCGPLFNVVLSPGSYRIRATYGAVTLTRTYQIRKSAISDTLYWPAGRDTQGF
jgi:hypothetical protein